MTREEAKEILPIIKAFSEGKTIQFIDPNKPIHDWEDTNESPNFDRDTKFLWRIKPTPTYRPFKDAGECWQEMLQHEPFGWIKEESRDYGTILRSLMFINYTECCFGLGYRKTFADGFKCFTFADGTPFGVAMEEQP